MANLKINDLSLPAQSLTQDETKHVRGGFAFYLPDAPGDPTSSGTSLASETDEETRKSDTTTLQASDKE